ncbi:histidinol-phosphate transaminase [Demequina zhanjiangensis]|uniref:Histidinol-phosphate aminotransferase n=1 Tax=Demequina zhanjiangensis TaxID=3051659 RepID=A0ABT8G3L4_9MICO|nr:histidinol-phosphate transaminase [Demequina sp. SYSU T00b26]MDN4473688.1 histidinol-phosphate transaminase [Demequina sp. SYSU T00b26]
MTLPLRPDLAGLTPYGAPQLDVVARLNVNENPYAPPAVVVDAIATAVRQAASGLNRYPDRDALELRGDLASYLAVESQADFLAAENIWAANGSNEVMLHLHQAFGGPGRKVLSFAPTYSMYPEYARDTLTDYETLPRRADFTLDVDAAVKAIEELEPVMVIVASPNNPTGTALPLSETERLCAAVAKVPGGSLLVIDEAYAEFRRHGVPSALSLLPDHPELVVSRTMSKAFAMAGGRLGYLAAALEVVDALQIVRLPYHLSAITQASARAALAHHRDLQAQVDEIRAERDETVAWLREQGYTVADTDANFALFGPFEDREKVFQGMLERGVLIRVTGPEGWLRVSIGTPQEMALFRSALVEVVA